MSRERMNGLWEMLSVVVAAVVTGKFGFAGDAKSYAVLFLSALAMIWMFRALRLEAKLRHQEDDLNLYAEFGGTCWVVEEK